MTTIDINTLSKEQKKALSEQLRKDNQEAKRKKEEDFKAYKQLSASFIDKNIDSLVHHHEITESIIEKLFKEYEALREIKSSLYGVKINKQDSHTTTVEDGSASITIGWNTTIGFDGTESAGVEKIKEFISSLSTEDANNQKLSAAVNTFLKPNAKTGMLNPSKIIELSKLKEQFNDDRFADGIDIIFRAQQKRQNSMYVSGWKFVEVKGIPKKLEFRFTI